MRGFNESKTNTGSVLDDRFFCMILKQQKQKNEKTEAARRRFHTPAYNIGERRKRDKNENRLD